MPDGGQSVTLKVKFPDGSEMSLSDFLQQADEALAAANGIPSDAMVQLSDGTIMSAGQYQQMVYQYWQSAHQHANDQIKDFAARMTVAVEDLNSLHWELSAQSGEVKTIQYCLQAAMSGINAAFGADERGASKRREWNRVYPVLQGNFEALFKSVSNVSDGCTSASNFTFDIEKNTLALFGQQAVDPLSSD